MPYGKMSEANDLQLRAVTKCLGHDINYFLKKTKDPII